MATSALGTSLSCQKPLGPSKTVQVMTARLVNDGFNYWAALSRKIESGVWRGGLGEVVAVPGVDLPSQRKGGRVRRDRSPRRRGNPRRRNGIRGLPSGCVPRRVLLAAEIRGDEDRSGRPEVGELRFPRLPRLGTDRHQRRVHNDAHRGRREASARCAVEQRSRRVETLRGEPPSSGERPKFRRPGSHACAWWGSTYRSGMAETVPRRHRKRS